MENISFKLDASFSKEIKNMMNEFNYSTKTEFIRDALREKIRQLKSESAWRKFQAYRGTAGKTHSDGEYHKLKEEAGEEFLAELKKKFK